VLNLVVAEELYRKNPGQREGILTTWKSLLVSRRTLGRVAARLDLGAFLRTGPSLEMRASLPRSVLGNTLEALIGAIFLDGGFQPAARATLRCLEPELSGIGEAHEKILAKQILQLFAQKELGALPRYRVLQQFDHPETTAFEVRAELGSRTFPSAWGTTKKDAERRAAWEAILILRREENLAG
ncbi:MAG: ribonuclease III family protein, partial [Planctomycetota bacterium]